MKCEEHIFCHSSYWTRDGILFCKLTTDIIINEELAKNMVQARKLTFGQRKMPMCIDIENLLSVDAIARRYLASKEAWQYLTAGAIHTNNKLLALLSQAWFQLDRPPVPFSIFNSQEAALRWLQQHKASE